MRKFILAAGAAALAMTVPALADPNKGQGGGGQKAQGGGQAKADRGGGQAKADRGGSQKAQRGGGQAKADRGNAKPERAQRQAQARPDRGRSEAPRNARADVRGADQVRSGKIEKSRGSAAVEFDRDDNFRLVRRDFDNGIFAGRGLANACPPGLDKKDNGCMPPGQVKNLLGAPLAANFAARQLPLQYRNWYPDNDNYYFRSGDGFIYRVNRSNDLVDGLIPLFGSGYYALGDPWPQPYDFYNVPNQYRGYWNDGDQYHYRYGDGAIYRLDPTTNAVNAIVALLAGDLGVGSRLPMGYDAYNVPLAYRSQYYDTNDAWYRYNDGYIYRVDPTTRLITAVIDAIV